VSHTAGGRCAIKGDPSGGVEYRAIKVDFEAKVEVGFDTDHKRLYVALGEDCDWSLAGQVIKGNEALYGEPVIEDVRGDRLWYEWNVPTEHIAKYFPHVRNKEDVPHEHAIPDLYGLAEGVETKEGGHIS
jgi:hypothetical protein